MKRLHGHLAFLVLATCTVAGLCGLSACRAPGPIVPEDTFVEVMIELHLVDALRTTYDERRELRRAVFERYSVSETTVLQTIEYYATEPDEYSAVYGRIVDRLTEESARTSDI